MKMFSFITAFLFALTVSGYSQKGDVRTTTIKEQGNALDTVVTVETDLSFNRTFPNNYKKDESVVQALRPYLVSEIVDPINHSHPLYLERARDGIEKLSTAKTELLEFMKVNRSLRERLARFKIGTEADLNAVTFVPVPRYYLTANIVYFENGENVAKYYNLAEVGHQYLAFRNNRLFGYLDFNEGKSKFKSDFIPAHRIAVESYNQIVKLGKTPITLNQGISKSPKNVRAGGHPHVFGYLDQGQLIFSYYEESVVQKVGTDAYVAPEPRFRKVYTLKTAEAFFFGNGSQSLINQWLERSVSTL